MEETLALAKSQGAVALHLFLLVPVGCGVEIAEDQQISPDEYEEVLNWMYDAEMAGGIELKATCAPHYFRIVAQRRAEEAKLGIRRQRPDSQQRQKHAGSHPGGNGRSGGSGHPGGHPGGHPHGQGRHAMNAMTKGCLAGTGVAFISHRGEVFPCGYLPLEAGNIRQQNIADVWHYSPLFGELRDPGLLGGACGMCEFTHLCGGCRARSYGMLGDHLAEEPFCTYIPIPMREEAA
jgi:radical SAM protein with 4Fe4S-binding SPASM domain